MKTVSLFLLSSVTYGALASSDTIDLPKDIDVSYNEKLDELLKVQQELQAALKSLLSSPVFNEEEFDSQETNTPTETPIEAQIDKREEDSSKDSSKDISKDLSKDISTRETVIQDEKSQSKEANANQKEEISREVDSGDAQVEPIEKPELPLVIEIPEENIEEYVDPSALEISTSIPKISSFENNRPIGYLKPNGVSKDIGYSALSYQTFKPKRIVFPKSTFQEEYSYPSFNSTPTVRNVSIQSVEESHHNRELKTSLFRGASQSKYRRSKLGQYIDAASYWKALREQALIRPPLPVYVDIKAVENAADSLTRMQVRTSSQNKADMIQLYIEKGSKDDRGDIQDLKEAEAAALAAVAHFAQHRNNKLTIHSYYDHIKHHTVHTALNLHLGPILGRGGNAIVLQATAADRFTQTILGAQRVAIKVLYVERHRTVDMTENDYLSLFREEVHVEATPATYAARSGKFESSADLNEKGGFLTFKMSSELSPYVDGEIVLCDGYVFYSKVLIFERMVIDVRSLVLPCPTISRKYNAHCSILSMDERLYIAKQMLLRVAAFHSMGLVHYDIKPANFLISNKGKVVLADFGFTAPAGSPMECGSNCTPKYQDPDTAACTLKRQTLTQDYEYDAWSLGLSMYYVITNGEYPYSISRKHNILTGLAEFLEQDPQEIAFLKGEAVWQTMERLGVPNYLSQSITLLLQPRRQDRPTPLKLLSMYSEYLNGN